MRAYFKNISNIQVTYALVDAPTLINLLAQLSGLSGFKNITLKLELEEQNGTTGMGEVGGEEVRGGFELNTLYNVGNS